MKQRKQKKMLRSAARKLSNQQLMGMGEFMATRVNDGEKLNQMETYTLKSLAREMKKRIQKTKD